LPSYEFFVFKLCELAKSGKLAEFNTNNGKTTSASFAPGGATLAKLFFSDNRACRISLSFRQRRFYFRLSTV
jgi:hypothetical protein